MLNARCQATVLDKPLDVSVLPYNVVIRDQKLALALGTAQPLMNFALENYAHCHWSKQTRLKVAAGGRHCLSRLDGGQKYILSVI